MKIKRPILMHSFWLVLATQGWEKAPVADCTSGAWDSGCFNVAKAVYKCRSSIQYNPLTWFFLYKYLTNRLSHFTLEFALTSPRFKVWQQLQPGASPRNESLHGLTGRFWRFTLVGFAEKNQSFNDWNTLNHRPILENAMSHEFVNQNLEDP